MKIKSIKTLTFLSLVERNLLANLKPWSKDYWSKKTVIGGIDVSDQIKVIKTKIASDQLSFLENRCCYCGSNFGITSDDELDHFINKARKPEFTFDLQNLFVACHKCNFPTRKGQRKTFWRDKRKYSKCRFKIFHPHFDDADKHFEYRIKTTATGNFVVTINPLTRKAKKTLSFFGLNEPGMVEYRAGTYMQLNFTNTSVHQNILNQITQNQYFTI